MIYFTKRIILFLINNLKKNFFKLLSPKPQIIFAGNNFVFKKLKKKKLNVFKFNSPEFEKISNYKFKIEKKYIVYIDQDMHQSFDNVVTHGQEQIINNKRYEKKLIDTINSIKNIKSLAKFTLIIAAHPRRRKKINFKNTKLIFNKTIELISSAKVVLAHTSLAIKYAVLLKKPIILLNAKNYFNSENLAEINFLKKNLDLQTFDISDKNFTKINNFKIKSINLYKYKKFKNKFINFPTSKKFGRWSEITRILKRFSK